METMMQMTDLERREAARFVEDELQTEQNAERRRLLRLVQSALRIAESRKDWVCPETYALTLQAVETEIRAKKVIEAECAGLRELVSENDAQGLFNAMPRQPDAPPVLDFDPKMNARINDALCALAFPLTDYQAFAVEWPYSAEQCAKLHDWLHRQGLTPNTQVQP